MKIKNDKKIRDSIRDKIFEDWSSGRGRFSQDNIWSDATIQIFLQKWLKNPSEKYTMEAARAAKITQKNVISEQEKKKIEQIAEELPDEVMPETEPYEEDP